MDKLSELEGCVLGLFWKHGTCTPYVIRKEFLDSPSPHWSGSAGAIYPLVKRLVRRGLIHAAGRKPGARSNMRYGLTPAGRRALEGWLEPPHAARTLGVPSDPLRTRVEFLNAIPSRRRLRFLAEAQRQLKEELAAIASHNQALLAQRDLAAYAAGRGAYLSMQARLAWLKECRKLLSAQDSGRR